MNKKILLPSKKFFKSEEEDLNINISLDDNQKLLREGDKNIVLDINEQFNKERNASNIYKIYGKIRMIFRNMYHGTSSYDPINKFLYPVNDNLSLTDGFIQYNEFALLRNDILQEFFDYNSSPKITLKGNEYTGHTVTTNLTAPHKNWNLYLTYVYSGDTQHPMNYTTSDGTGHTFMSGDGIPFNVISGDTIYTLTSPVEHGMNKGECIIILGQPHSIIDVGDETYNSEKYVLKILKTTVITNNSIIFGKRCIDINKVSETTSTYYVHKHKTLTEYDGCSIDNAGFEKSIWKDERKILSENSFGEKNKIVEKNRMETILYGFKEPIVLDDMLNNLGYTPTEVYVSVVFRNGNGYFYYPPKVGYDFNFHDTWIDKNFNGTNTSVPPFETGISGTTFSISGITFNSGNTLNTGTTLTGAFVEYNDFEMKERIISNSLHKIAINLNVFNHGQTSDIDGFSGATITNAFGLYYQPHYKVKLRELSPYIETSDTDKVYNLPENTKYFPSEGLWKWHDLYDHGFIDPDGFGTNYPFTNNIHYVKTDINFYLRNEANRINKTDGLINFNNKKIDC